MMQPNHLKQQVIVYFISVNYKLTEFTGLKNNNQDNTTSVCVSGQILHAVVSVRHKVSASAFR